MTVSMVPVLLLTVGQAAGPSLDLPNDLFRNVEWWGRSTIGPQPKLLPIVFLRTQKFHITEAR